MKVFFPFNAHKESLPRRARQALREARMQGERQAALPAVIASQSDFLSPLPSHGCLSGISNLPLSLSQNRKMIKQKPRINRISDSTPNHATQRRVLSILRRAARLPSPSPWPDLRSRLALGTSSRGDGQRRVDVACSRSIFLTRLSHLLLRSGEQDRTFITASIIQWEPQNGIPSSLSLRSEVIFVQTATTPPPAPLLPHSCRSSSAAAAAPLPLPQP